MEKRTTTTRRLWRSSKVENKKDGGIYISIRRQRKKEPFSNHLKGFRSDGFFQPEASGLLWLRKLKRSAQKAKARWPTL